MQNQSIDQSIGQLLRLVSVITKVGLSKSEIYRRVKLGTFPAPIKLGARAVAWSQKSIDDWVTALIQQEAK